MSHQIQESGEMYLESILILSKRLSHIRAVDIAEQMNFSKPSVSRALKILLNDGYIDIDTLGAVTLTDSGREIAEKIYARHEVLTEYLIMLGVPADIAEKDACRIEHYISNETFVAVRNKLEEEKAK